MKARRGKYNNKYTIVDGICFDSIKEANRYKQLSKMKSLGQIRDLELQKSYILIPKFIKNGKTYRPLTYRADFTYFDIKTNKTIVEDVKRF